jgi:hypothetical protein
MVSLMICMTCSFIAGWATAVKDNTYVFWVNFGLAIYFFFVVVGQLD